MHTQALEIAESLLRGVHGSSWYLSDAETLAGEIAKHLTPSNPAALSGRLNAFCDHLIHQEECWGFVPEVQALERENEELRNEIGPAFPGLYHLFNVADIPAEQKEAWKKWSERVEKLLT